MGLLCCLVCSLRITAGVGNRGTASSCSREENGGPERQPGPRHVHVDGGHLYLQSGGGDRGARSTSCIPKGIVNYSRSFEILNDLYVQCTGTIFVKLGKQQIGKGGA